MTGPETLAEATIAPLLRTRRIGRAWRHLARTGSTNDEARAWAEAGAPDGAVVVAEEQTRGRGRQGRAWHAAPGQDVTLSVVLRPAFEPAAAGAIALAAGVAVAEAVLETAGARATLKWPNDVLAGGRKVAGVLAEASTQAGRLAWVVLGVGVNVNATSFPPALADAATSLRLVAGRAIDRPALCAALCGALERWIDRLLAEGPAPAIDAFRARAELGVPVRVRAGARVVEGVALDLDASGALIVLTAAGARELVHGGEVVAWGPER